MTGRPAPAPIPRGAGRPSRPVWPPSRLPGLWVDLGGRYHQPAARFTCRHGCDHHARGAAEVAQFTREIDDIHARRCPGPSKEPNRG